MKVCGEDVYKECLAEMYKILSPNDIDKYISLFNGQPKFVLTKVRAILRVALPKATEEIDKDMLSFWQGGTLIHFSASKTHLEIHVTPSCVKAFAGRLARGYDCSYRYSIESGTIFFPYKELIPYSLIVEIAEFRVKEVRKKKKNNG